MSTSIISGNYVTIGTTNIQSVQESVGDFNAILEQQTNSLNSVMDFQNTSNKNSVAKNEGYVHEHKKAEKATSATNPLKNKQGSSDNLGVHKNDNTLSDEEVIACAESIAGSMMEEIASMLDLPVEEINSLLDNLGIEVSEVLDGSNLAQLLLAAQGSSDMVDLVTDQGLYERFQELDKSLSEIIKQFDSATYAMEDVTQLLSVGELEEVIEISNESDELILNTQNNGVEMQVLDESEGVTVIRQSESDSDNAQDGTEENSFDFLSFNEQTIATLTEEQSVSSAFTTTQSDQVMNQIMDQMANNVKGQVTELEMQLNPESLGKVNVRLVAEESGLTAKFTAENEMVKGILESQLVQLKENFTNQGIKVNAVEVAVEYQAFDENKQQDDRNEKATEDGKKGRAKFLSIDELDENLEIYTEEEQLAVQIMQDNGNSIDYVG